MTKKEQIQFLAEQVATLVIKPDSFPTLKTPGERSLIIDLLNMGKENIERAALIEKRNKPWRPATDNLVEE